jgi:hypothetical protein
VGKTAFIGPSDGDNPVDNGAFVLERPMLMHPQFDPVA